MKALYTVYAWLADEHHVKKMKMPSVPIYCSLHVMIIAAMYEWNCPSTDLIEITFIEIPFYLYNIWAEFSVIQLVVQ